MAEISKYGYSKIREFIKNNWKYIELQDQNGSPVIRLGIGDKRVSWVHEQDAQTLILQIVVTGNDVGATTGKPITIAKSAIFDVANNGTAIAVEDFLESDIATLSQPEDKVTVKHSIEVPKTV